MHKRKLRDRKDEKNKGRSTRINYKIQHKKKQTKIHGISRSLRHSARKRGALILPIRSTTQSFHHRWTVRSAAAFGVNNTTMHDK